MTSVEKPADKGSTTFDTLKTNIDCQDVLQKIYLFFNEITYSLKNLPLEESHVFKLTNNISLLNLKKRNFICNTKRNEHDGIQRFIFRYHLIGEHDYNIKLATEEEANFLVKILTERRIRFQQFNEDPNTIGRHILFNITPRITTRFIFVPDAETGLIHLTVSNYDGKWDQNLKFKPERLTDELLDEIAKYALHQDNDFLELTGNRLSLTMLEKLRAQIHGEENKRHPQPPKHSILDFFKRQGR